MHAIPVPFAEISRALVIKLRHHGDVLLTTPVFSALQRAAPQCEIDALVYAETTPMLDGHPAIAKIHAIDRNWKRLGGVARTAAEWRIFAALRARHYDLIVHLTDNWRGAWLVRSLQPRFSAAGFSPLQPPTKLWARSFTHLAPWPPLGNRHTVECHLDVLRALGIQPGIGDRRLTFQPGEAACQRIEALLAPHGIAPGRLIHIHPASRWMFKAWTVEGYAELITALAECGYRLVMTTGPAAREMALATAILERCRIKPIDLSGQLTLKELGAVIGTARLSICVDSVPMHLAAALGTPVVALFGPSNEHEWGPWQVPQRVLVSQHSCRPCRLDGCGGGKISECLTSLSSTEVLAAAESLLAETA
jgi:heptosyltransferase-3